MQVRPAGTGAPVSGAVHEGTHGELERRGLNKSPNASIITDMRPHPQAPPYQ